MPRLIRPLDCTDQEIRNVKESPTRLDGAKKLLKDMGGKFNALYLTLRATIF